MNKPKAFIIYLFFPLTFLIREKEDELPANNPNEEERNRYNY